LKVLFLASTFHDQSFGKVLEDILALGDEEIIACIDEHIGYITDRNGHPQPPIAKPLRDVDGELCEIRTKYGKEDLLRIYYFVDKETDSLILLNAIIKPDGRKMQSHYEGKVGRKLERDIEESIQLALKFKTDYLISKNDYQKYSL
jgi:hypothetical protein